MAKLTGATNWQGSFTAPNGTEDQIKAGHFGIELQTKGKYLDKNIQIDYVPPTAVFNVNEDKTTVQTGGWIQAGEEVGKVNAGTAKSDNVTINKSWQGSELKDENVTILYRDYLWSDDFKVQQSFTKYHRMIVSFENKQLYLLNKYNRTSN